MAITYLTSCAIAISICLWSCWSISSAKEEALLSLGFPEELAEILELPVGGR